MILVVFLPLHEYTQTSCLKPTSFLPPTAHLTIYPTANLASTFDEYLDCAQVSFLKTFPKLIFLEVKNDQFPQTQDKNAMPEVVEPPLHEVLLVFSQFGIVLSSVFSAIHILLCCRSLS